MGRLAPIALMAWLTGCVDPVVGIPLDTLTDEEVALAHELAPPELPGPPADPSNAWADHPDAARLGQRLFFDPSFSGALLSADNDGGPMTLGSRGETGRVSCAGCHVPTDGFVDTRSMHQQISLASDWVLRRTPTLLDVAQARLFMWDGRRDALYNQPFGAIESAAEMNSSRLFVAQRMFASYRADYEALFGTMPPLDDVARFGSLDAQTTGCRGDGADQVTECDGLPGDEASYDALTEEDRREVTRVVVGFGKAIGAYERLLSCGPGRFDAWVHGDAEALDETEILGFTLFAGRAGCVRCHGGPFFSDFAFHNVGLSPERVATVFIDAGDVGAAEGIRGAQDDALNVRGEFSDGDDGRLPDAIEPSLLGAFRTPSLRCAASRPSFMHTGQLASLEDVVRFFDRGGDRVGYPGDSELAGDDGRPTPLGLTDLEIAALVAFLGTLEGPGPDPALLTAP
ncbi:MAG: cytochrome-c peroxidase [Sandaracinaceae bacterium]